MRDRTFHAIGLDGVSPFQHVRLWARRAPAGERIAAVAACAALLAALAFVAAPGGHTGANAVSMGAASGLRSGGQTAQGASSSGGPGGTGPLSGAASPGSGAAGPVSGAASGNVVSNPAQGPRSTPPAGQPGLAGGSSQAGRAAVSSGTGSSAPGGASTGVPRCTSPPGSAPGVTATEIKIAITLVNIAGPAANNAFAVPSTTQQQADYEAVIKNLNATGGVACRKLVPQFYTANPADTAGLQQTCLTIVQSGAFAELDFNGYASIGGSCFAQNHMPFFGSYYTSASQIQQFYPYIFDMDTYDSLYHNTVFGLKQRGFFQPSNGFKKLGFVYRDCLAGVVPKEIGWLEQAGLSRSQIVTYDVGCPDGGGGLASPSDDEQAILKFMQAGVTNVTTADFTADFANFTTVAQQQGFDPKYGVADDALIPVTYGADHPDYQNISGAIAIEASRDGEERTPGLSPTPATARCNSIDQSAGQPATYQQLVGAGGLICDQVWMFQAAVDHAAVMARSALAGGLQASGSVHFSYPEGPNNFAGPGITFGGQYWRTAQFQSACACWRVIDPTFQPGFARS